MKPIRCALLGLFLVGCHSIEDQSPPPPRITTETFLDRAQRRIEAGDQAGARDDLHEALARDPENVDARELLESLAD